MPALKTVLKRAVPWHARRTLSFASSTFKKRKPPFDGVFTKYADVPNRHQYNKPGWARSCRAAVDKIRAIQGPLVETGASAKWLLPVLVASMNRRVSILDFGGAAGTDYAWLRLMAGGADVEYHVVDTQAACVTGRDMWPSSPITFHEELPAAQAFDIVYSYSAVHCVAEPLALLTRLAETYTPASILLCKHPIHTGPSFVRAQTNMGGAMAQWVLNLYDVENALPGYRLAFKVLGEDNYNVDNFQPPYNVGTTAELLFRRGGLEPKS